MIDLINISKHYLGRELFRDASLRIDEGERVGVVGPNGSGKTTLFRLVTGEITPDRGDVLKRKNIRMGYVRQEVEMSTRGTVLLREHAADALAELSGWHDEIHRLEALIERDPSRRAELLSRIGELQTSYEHAGGYEMDQRADKTLCALGFRAEELERPLAQFSGGWRMRAELARVLVAEPDLLLLDEPSNYLDLPAIEWLRGFIQSFHGTLLLISHDRHLLDTLTRVTVECGDGGLTRYPGNHAFYRHAREQRYERLAAARKNQDRRRAEIERFVERFRAKNTKASQVQSRIKMLENMERIDVPEHLFSNRRIELPAPPHAGRDVLTLHEVGLTYNGTAWILRGVNLRIQRGEKWALVGFNGIGKTTLLRMLAQALPPSCGEIRTGHRVITGYQSQEFSEIMPPSASLFHVIKEANGEVHDTDVRALLGAFGFSGEQVHKTVQTLSGGEKIRLAFARIFIRPPNLLILDEPTTHLDMATREALEQALVDYGGTVCFVSHDTEFVRRTASGIIEITPQGVRSFHGSYDYYLEKRAVGGALPAGDAAAACREEHIHRKRKQRSEQKKNRQHMLHLRRRVREIEDRIEQLGDEQGALLAALASTEGAPDYEALNRRLTELQQALHELHESWETHALELEEIEQPDG